MIDQDSKKLFEISRTKEKVKTDCAKSVTNFKCTEIFVSRNAEAAPDESITFRFRNDESLPFLNCNRLECSVDRANIPADWIGEEGASI